MSLRDPFLSAVLPGIALLLAGEYAVAETAGNGITFDAVYTGEPIRNVSGGIRTGGTYLDNLDLQLTADRGSLFGVPGLSGLLYVLYNNSSEFSAEYPGDALTASNIDAPRALRLYEAWLDWATDPNERFSARAGLYDLNSEFDSIETGGLFLNSAHGVGPDFSQTGLNGPSIFPVTSLALRLRTTSANGAYGQLAVLDGVPGDPEHLSSNGIYLSHDDGALLVAEGGWGGGAWRKLAVGLWRYTADFNQLAATTPSGGPQRGDSNNGWYAIADRTLWTGDGSTAAGFLRIGQADARYNTFDGYLGVGGSLTGFWSARPEDTLGLGIATAFTGDEYRKAQELAGSGADAQETSIELTYRTPITDWLTLQPDIQYVINPGTDPALDNALVILLRFELSFSRTWGHSP